MKRQCCMASPRVLLQGEVGRTEAAHSINRVGGRARRFVFVPPNLDGFMAVHKIVGRELDWLRRRFIFVPPNLLGCSNLSPSWIDALCCACLVILGRDMSHLRWSDRDVRDASGCSLRIGAKMRYTKLCSPHGKASGKERPSTVTVDINVIRVYFGSLLSISAGLGISVSILLRSSGPQTLWRLAARLRRSFDIGRFGIAIDTFVLLSNRGLKPSPNKSRLASNPPDVQILTSRTGSNFQPGTRIAQSLGTLSFQRAQPSLGLIPGPPLAYTREQGEKRGMGLSVPGGALRRR